MSHNSEADFASSELARMFVATPSLCYSAASVPATLNATASYEPSSTGWPKADGLVSLLESIGGVQRDIAIEYKRPQEGIHGLLTAIGQAHGYIHKGYSASAIVIPSSYPTHPTPADYVKEVLDRVSTNPSIGVFRYDSPDTGSATPFAGKLHCVRPFILAMGGGTRAISGHGAKTQWVHMREGSTTRDGFFRFLQTAKRLSGGPVAPPVIPIELVRAIGRIEPGRSAASYLANTADARFLTRVWEAFWFEWVATPEVLTPWERDGSRYVVPNVSTKILKDDGSGYSQIWQGRTTSLKEKLVAKLNSRAITEEQAWEMFAAGIPAAIGGQSTQGIRQRAHSYREDIDSSLAQLEWIDSTGIPTDYGYRYMTLCERYGGANSDAAKSYMGATLLQTGRYASFLHYVHRLSERKFSADPLAYTRMSPAGRPEFTEDSYWEYLADLEGLLSNDLRVMRKVSGRARPRVRTEFQAELTLLRNYGFVSPSRYRLGIGIPIDWERVNEALNIEL